MGSYSATKRSKLVMYPQTQVDLKCIVLNEKKKKKVIVRVTGELPGAGFGNSTTLVEMRLR